MSAMTMTRTATSGTRVRLPKRVRDNSRGPQTRPSLMARPAGRPVHPSRPVIANSRPVTIQSMTVEPGWHLTDRGIAAILGLGGALFVAAAVVIVLQFIALGAPIA